MKMNMINIKGIIILAAILIIFHLAFGMFISPMVSSIIIDKINESSKARIDVEKISVWPLTLSFSLKGLEISDPDTKGEMIRINKASAKLSLIGLLSKRIVISRLNVNGTVINLKSEPGGGFNIEKIAQPTEPAEGQRASRSRPSVFDRFRKGRDWFSRIYNIVKKRGSKEGVDRAREERKSAGRITRDITQLPRGRRVHFQTVRSGYLFEIRSLSMKNVNIHAKEGNRDAIDIERGALRLRGIAFDPRRGAKFDSAKIKGELKKDGARAGNFTLLYQQSFKGNDLKTRADLTAKNVDLPALDFFYRDSLPVEVKKGILNLKSNSTLVNEELFSKNTLTLREHELAPKKGTDVDVGFIAMPILCKALNHVSPATLEFEITGTLDNPQFGGFQESLNRVIEPYLVDIAQSIEEEGLSALGKLFGGQSEEETTEGAPAEGEGEESEDPAQQAVDAIKSLFGK